MAHGCKDYRRNEDKPSTCRELTGEAGDGLRKTAILGGATLRQADRLSSSSLDVLGLGALVTVHKFVVNKLSFVQGLVPGAKNRGVMDKNILSLILTDEAEAPAVIEPFNLSTGHNSSFHDSASGRATHQGTSTTGAIMQNFYTSNPQFIDHAGISARLGFALGEVKRNFVATLYAPFCQPFACWRVRRPRGPWQRSGLNLPRCLKYLGFPPI